MRIGHLLIVISILFRLIKKSDRCFIQYILILSFVFKVILGVVLSYSTMILATLERRKAICTVIEKETC